MAERRVFLMRFVLFSFSRLVTCSCRVVIVVNCRPIYGIITTTQIYPCFLTYYYTELNLNFLNCCMSLIFECFLVPSIVVLVPRYTCQCITALPHTIYYTILHSVMANQIILMTTCRLVMMLYSTSSSFDTDNNPN